MQYPPHDPIRQDAERREAQNRWNTRLQAYAWVLFLIGSAAFMSIWSEDIRQWVETTLQIPASAN